MDTQADSPTQWVAVATSPITTIVTLDDGCLGVSPEFTTSETQTSPTHLPLSGDQALHRTLRPES
jgi:hypothetical protein